MRKLALVAAALLPLLGGCVSSTCDYPTVSLRWTLQDVNGFAWSCSAAGVDWVDVYIGSAPGVRFSCFDGGATIDVSRFAPGTYPVTVEGIDVDGVTIWDRARPFNVSVGTCGDFYAQPVLGEGLLDVDYHFVPDVCHGGYMWYALYDEVAGQYISAVNFGSPPGFKTAFGCYSTAGGTPLRFPVPFGTYTLAWIQEVLNPLATLEADVTPVQQACVQFPVDVTSAGTTTYPVTLSSNVATACAPYP